MPDVREKCISRSIRSTECWLVHRLTRVNVKLIANPRVISRDVTLPKTVIVRLRGSKVKACFVKKLELLKCENNWEKSN